MEFKIKKNEVHLWRASLDRLAKNRKDLEKILSSQERARVQRFHFEKDQFQFLMTRGILRTLLGRYLEKDPQQIMIQATPQGKPRLTPSGKKTKIQFNVSHSRGRALFAFSLDRELGIDLEAVDPGRDILKIARRHFCPSELEKIQAAPRSRQKDVFYHFWTLKEAFLKGMGEGLRFPLSQVEMVSDRRQSFFQVRNVGKISSASWVLVQLPNPFPGFKAALAVKGNRSQVKPYFTFSASTLTL